MGSEKAVSAKFTVEDQPAVEGPIADHCRYVVVGIRSGQVRARFKFYEEARGHADKLNGHVSVNSVRPIAETEADDGIVLDRLARMLNEYPQWNVTDIGATLATWLTESGREIFDGSLPENRNTELSDAEHYEANAEAAYLVGKVVRDDQGRVFRVTEWDRLGKDGWATVGNGDYWARPEDCTVLTGDEAWPFLSVIGGVR